MAFRVQNWDPGRGHTEFMGQSLFLRDGSVSPPTVLADFLGEQTLRQAEDFGSAPSEPTEAISGAIETGAVILFDTFMNTISPDHPPGGIDFANAFLGMF